MRRVNKNNNQVAVQPVSSVVLEDIDDLNDNDSAPTPNRNDVLRRNSRGEGGGRERRGSYGRNMCDSELGESIEGYSSDSDFDDDDTPARGKAPIAAPKASEQPPTSQIVPIQGSGMLCRGNTMHFQGAAPRGVVASASSIGASHLNTDLLDDDLGSSSSSYTSGTPTPTNTSAQKKRRTGFEPENITVKATSTGKQTTFTVRLFQRLGKSTVLGVGVDGSGVPYVARKYPLFDAQTCPKGLTEDGLRRARARVSTVMKMGSHRHCLQHCGTCLHSDCLYVVTKYAAGGSLRQYLQTLKQRHEMMARKKHQQGHVPPSMSRPGAPINRPSSSSVGGVANSSGAASYSEHSTDSDVDAPPPIKENAFMNSSPTAKQQQSLQHSSPSSNMNSGSGFASVTTFHTTFNERNIAVIVRQLVAAVAQVHRNGIPHGAVNANNILFDGDSDGAGSGGLTIRLSGFVEGVVAKNAGAPRHSAFEDQVGKLPNMLGSPTGNHQQRHQSRVDTQSGLEMSQIEDSGVFALAVGSSSPSATLESDIIGIGDVVYELAVGVPPTDAIRTGSDAQGLEAFSSSMSKLALQFLRLCWTSLLSPRNEETGRTLGQSAQDITIKDVLESRFISTAPNSSQSTEILEMEEHAATRRRNTAIECIKQRSVAQRNGSGMGSSNALKSNAQYNALQREVYSTAHNVNTNNGSTSTTSSPYHSPRLIGGGGIVVSRVGGPTKPSTMMVMDQQPLPNTARNSEASSGSLNGSQQQQTPRPIATYRKLGQISGGNGRSTLNQMQIV